jgi:hypothetical protein
MNRSKTHRQLAFERLESKSAPSSLLLLLATQAELNCLSDEVLCDIPSCSSATVQTIASKWQFDHSPQVLIDFISANTSQSPAELETWTPPTQADCDSADEMMKLEDEALHTLILSERFPLDNSGIHTS